MSKDDILKIKREKQALKAEASRAATMAREEAEEYGQTWKQERTDQGYQQKLNGAGMAQMMGGGWGRQLAARKFDERIWRGWSDGGVVAGISRAMVGRGSNLAATKFGAPPWTQHIWYQ